jgi:hypothetical protein
MKQHTTVVLAIAYTALIASMCWLAHDIGFRQGHRTASDRFFRDWGPVIFGEVRPQLSHMHEFFGSVQGEYDVVASRPPGANDDSYGVSATWFDDTTGMVYVCMDRAPKAAVWYRDRRASNIMFYQPALPNIKPYGLTVVSQFDV